ncbi:hypothetical protein LA080_009436 [Diaporthe eres]|nr:hypothetical protein LA080_009436 [Diaporthe eres]
MGNNMSAGSRQNQVTQYLNNPRLPLEISLMIAAQLCPNCSIEEDAIPASEDARELQRALDEDMAVAQHFNNRALPKLLDRMIAHGRLGDQLQYLSIRDFTIQFKAGVTKPRLQRFMATSLNLGIPIPNFVPGLLSLPDRSRESLSEVDSVCWLVFFSQNPPAATLPSVTTLGIPKRKGRFQSLFMPPRFQMEALLRSFPNLRAFQSDEAAFSWSPYRRTPANSPPLFPNIRRLVLAAEQPGRLHHLTQVLGEFPHIEELYYHRRTGERIGEFDPTFSNANVFNSVHHCLRRLTYLSNTITQAPNLKNYFIAIDCYEEERFSDVPHFAAFKLLEDLTIEQGLLGRLATVHDRVNSATGPYFPDLDYRLPQTLRRLTVKFVYDWPRLASQLVALATAKQRGQFPLLSDVFVVIVRSCTVESDGVWPPLIPLTPSKDLIRDSGELMRAAGIKLWTSTTEIDPPPGDSADYPHDIVPEGSLVTFDVQRRFFNDT